MTKKEFIEQFSLFEDFESKASASRAYEHFVDIIISHVSKGNTVNLSGFGKFELFKLANGKSVPKFRAFTKFKEAVQKSK